MLLLVCAIVIPLLVVLSQALGWIISLGRLIQKADDKLAEFERTIYCGDIDEIEKASIAACIAVNDARAKNVHEVDFICYPIAFTLRSGDNLSRLWERYSTLQQRALAQKLPS